jgi:hypothetical protein
MSRRRTGDPPKVERRWCCGKQTERSTVKHPISE